MPALQQGVGGEVAYLGNSPILGRLNRGEHFNPSVPIPIVQRQTGFTCSRQIVLLVPDGDGHRSQETLHRSATSVPGCIQVKDWPDRTLRQRQRFCHRPITHHGQFCHRAGGKIHNHPPIRRPQPSPKAR